MHDQRAKDLLNDETRQFALLVNSVTDCAIYMLDEHGSIRTWNPGGQRIKGYDAAEVIGTSFSRFYPQDEIVAGVPGRNLHTAATEGRYLGEGWRVRKDGTRFRASVVIDPIIVDGELIGFAKITRDVSERHAAQERLQDAQKTLLQAQKMEAIGKLTLGMAHDFNNLLTVIVNCLDLVAVKTQDAHTRKLIDTATGAAERGALLTRQLLTFGRGQTLSPERLSINTVLEECAGMLRRSAGDSIALELDLAPELPDAFIDRAQLEAAILNLVCNSRDAMPAGGHLRVHTRLKFTQNPAQPQLPHDTYLCVGVHDDGDGIPVEHQARVFEPFFTTKAVGRGSGLGLSQVFGFTAQSGGFTQLDSAPGQGTHVTLHFPVM